MASKVKANPEAELFKLITTGTKQIRNKLQSIERKLEDGDDRRASQRVDRPEDPTT